ncbi:hypothetical protein Tco_0803411 [Tanacetum coccineum]|uniref:Uncharacterized protein n=1 Tax=Tanacetum coccineum TaxID=301880 RepID=A0ABQ5A5W2_9ASTR
MLKQQKLMQTQEDHLNPIQALHVDSLKVDLIVILNTCSEKEDSNSKTASSKSVKESILDYATKDKSIAERTCHQRQYDRRLKMQTQESKIDTDADDADIRPIYDEEPMAKVQLTAECNLFAIGQQHTEQLEISHEGRVDQYPEQCQVQSPMLVTQQYLPKRRESVFAKPDHMITSSESRNSSKNMPRFSSNDMVHNHYLDKASKKTQEIDRNSKTSMMPSARFQSTADGSKPKPRSTNHSTRSLHVSKSSCITKEAMPIANHSKNSNSFIDYRHFICSTCHKCVFNANHDACIIKFLKEVNSRAKIQSNKTRISNKPIEQKSHTQNPVRQIFTGHRFPLIRLPLWVPTGTIFASCTSKDDSEPTHSSNVDIPNIHESKQTLHSSAEVSSTDMIVMTSMIEFESLFSPFFDEYFNGENQFVSKSSAVTTADASEKRQQQPYSTSSTSTLATTVTADGNFDL